MYIFYFVTLLMDFSLFLLLLFSNGSFPQLQITNFDHMKIIPDHKCSLFLSFWFVYSFV